VPLILQNDEIFLRSRSNSTGRYSAGTRRVPYRIQSRFSTSTGTCTVLCTSILCLFRKDGTRLERHVRSQCTIIYPKICLYQDYMDKRRWQSWNVRQNFGSKNMLYTIRYYVNDNDIQHGAKHTPIRHTYTVACISSDRLPWLIFFINTIMLRLCNDTF
jgi:hypothetical protein